MAKILKGAEVVSALNEKLKAEVASLIESGITPALAILRVGERPDDISYEKGAMKRCTTVGVAVRNIVLPETVEQEKLMAELRALNADSGIHGILLLRPLPKHLDEEALRRELSPEKDVDGITDLSLSGVFTGSGEGYPPCTAQACMEILKYYSIDCDGKRAVVIGRSLVVGRPVAMLLMEKNATVTICHTHTAELESIVRGADIVIAAAGQIESVTGDHLSPGQIVIDVGINWSDEKGKLCGDVDFEQAEPIVSAITPVPGGVGTVTTSVLVSHVVEAARKSLGA